MNRIYELFNLCTIIQCLTGLLVMDRASGLADEFMHVGSPILTFMLDVGNPGMQSLTLVETICRPGVGAGILERYM